MDVFVRVCRRLRAPGLKALGWNKLGVKHQRTYLFIYF